MLGAHCKMNEPSLMPININAITMASKLFSHLNNHPRTKLAIQLSFATIFIPSIPILYWSHNAKKEREEREHEVATKLR